MKYQQDRIKCIPAIVAILDSKGINQRNYKFEEVMKILYEKSNGEELTLAWLRYQGKVFSSLPCFG